MPSYKERVPLIKKIEERRKSRVLLYVTGDRPGLETQIHSDTYDFFVNLLDDMGVVGKISLILYTRGGSTLAGWAIANLIQHFCDEFEVIIPSKAHSTGTLISLGAKHIVMTKQATIGPIDPSVNSPLNPSIPGAAPDARVPVSVEAVNGFIELAKMNALNGEKTLDTQTVKDLLIELSGKVHPLVLGEVYRSKSQIQMLAKKMLDKSGIGQKKMKSVISFLCSESGSHDYTIHRREAIELGLPVEKPNETFYSEIKAVYDDFAAELKFTERWNPIGEIGANNELHYKNKRCLIETATGGSYYFLTEGKFSRTTIPIQMPLPQGVPMPMPAPPMQFHDNRIFEGWKYEKPGQTQP
jgi:hypothetical protein